MSDKLPFWWSMSDKLLREKLRAGTPRGSAVELAVSEIIVRQGHQADAMTRSISDYSKPWMANS